MNKKAAGRIQNPRPTLTTQPHLEFEHRLGFPRRILGGVDEVGRGCIAGPVVAAALVLPAEIDYDQNPWLREIRDSKLMSAEARERIAPLIEKWALSSAVGVASVQEIDRLNIFHASHLAMVRAVSGLSVAPDHVLVDGKFLPREGLQISATAVIKGDLQCLSIAAASVIAKVWRDRWMCELDIRYPGYGFAQHKGYPTPQHARALVQLGITEFHRTSFKTVAGLQAKLSLVPNALGSVSSALPPSFK